MTKNKFSSIKGYIKFFFKWVFLAVIVGAVGGIIGGVFHKCLDYVAEIQSANGWLIFLLPVGGVVIAFLYRLCKRWGQLDTNRVISAARDDERVPAVLIPLIYLSTLITHLLGGSAGREGAALQLGGSIGYNIGRLFKLKKDDVNIIVMSGMSGVFSALFGTPLTAAVFAVEVAVVGVMRYTALVPCLISACVAWGISQLFGNTPVKFELNFIPDLSPELMIKVILLALLCALVAIPFCTSLKTCGKYMKKLFPNDYIRAAVGGCIVILLTLVVGSRDYNGAGMSIIINALNGNVKAEAFILKIIFTSFTIASGFKGGEIVPTFFIGSTFGCLMGAILGIDPAFCAAIGFVTLFCCVVNCPVASVLLAVEVFGGGSIVFFAVACCIGFVFSGNYGLYSSQKMFFSRPDGAIANTEKVCNNGEK